MLDLIYFYFKKKNNFSNRRIKAYDLNEQM